MANRHEQKRLDIINAAFEKWSKDLYANTSLTTVAEAMNMTKPALFRYFSSKDSLFEAMIEVFLSDMISVAERVIADIENADFEQFIELLVSYGIDFFFEYRQRYYFVFFTSPIIKHIVISRSSFKQYRDRVVQLFVGLYERFTGTNSNDDSAEMMLFYIFYTSASTYFNYKKNVIGLFSEQSMNESQLADVKVIITDSLLHGFRRDGFGGELTDSDCEIIENTVINSSCSVERDKLFNAITSVIAECGIVDASMERIAKKMGFSSKSSLYSHFNSRDDMLQRLFENESQQILNFIKANGLKYDNLNKDLYGCMAATFCYFTKDTDVLRYFDWLHYRMVRESLHPERCSISNVFVSLAGIISSKYSDKYDVQVESLVLMAFILLSTFIVRIIVRKNEKNGGKTSPDEVRDLRQIYRLYMKGFEE